MKHVLAAAVLGIAYGINPGFATAQEGWPDGDGESGTSHAAPGLAPYVNWKDEVPNQSEALSEEIFGEDRAGLQVVRKTDGGFRVIWRGESLLGPGEPLYLLGGRPVRAGAGGDLIRVGSGEISVLSIVTPNRAISQYGRRGANGVVLIFRERSAPARNPPAGYSPAAEGQKGNPHRRGGGAQ